MDKRHPEFTVLIEKSAVKPATGFTVLVERRSLRKTVAALVAMTMSLSAMLGTQTAFAAPGKGKGPHKMASDLREEVEGKDKRTKSWARDRKGQKMVQVIFVSNADDHDMSDLKQEIKRFGGEINATMPGLRMVTATMPAKRVDRVAERADVEYVAPNRETFSTASDLEVATGTTSGGYVRSSLSKQAYTGLDGSGVGIAVLDSGVMRSHKAFENASGVSRVLRNVTMLNTQLSDWTTGKVATTLAPGSAELAAYEAAIANDESVKHDAWGHGTHVAAVAAGRSTNYISAPESSGIAPNANIIDVKVLSDYGVGSVSDTLEGIQWTISNAKKYNIRVINMSLASRAKESWQFDPLCIAVRNAAAVGITVVASAGNYGSILGKETYGTVMSPGNDPTVITVGSANHKATAARSDDVINSFSSRGPTRSYSNNSGGGKVYDDLIKPDLVAPGNRIMSAAATSATTAAPEWNNLAKLNAILTGGMTFTQSYRETQMYMSGTSVAAPVVAGAAAVLLQANPGLTPPLVKAILQYTAQPLTSANLLQQGAGLLNMHGAVTMARKLRTDISTLTAAGTLTVGTSMLATGQTMPAKSSVVNGETIKWSRMVFVGGNRIMTGDPIMTKFQAIYDPSITWVKGEAFKRTPAYWDAQKQAVRSVSEAKLVAAKLLSSGVIDGTGLLGSSSQANKTGLFSPTTSLMDLFVAGSGFVLSEGLVISEGLVLSEGLVISEGLVLSEGLVVSEKAGNGSGED